jgi:hypothetical protein
LSDYRRNHYVPQWYQQRFFQGNENEKKFHYLDLNPDKVKAPNGKIFTRNELLRWGPSQCFMKEDLYTTKFFDFESTEIEQYFFGKIDREGLSAVEYFSDFEHPSASNEAFQALIVYLSSQKLRTPKGFEFLKSITKNSNKNKILFKLQEYHKMHCALWTECVWSIADATDSEIKFICTDHPVTVYNKACFPSSRWCRGFNDPVIWLNGTHTIFPLSFEKCLILSNLSWVRNPYGNPVKERPNAKLFRTAMFKFTDIQTGRLLTDIDVNTINYIMKNRALRYIASTQKEWLYPENIYEIPRWDKIGDTFLLMPDPRSMTFSSEIIIGFKGGGSDSFDEYGRKPWEKDYCGKKPNDDEWHSFHAFQGEYARLFGPKRRGLSYEFGKLNKIEDNPDYHKYHLRLEQTSKPHVKELQRKKKKNNKSV